MKRLELLSVNRGTAGRLIRFLRLSLVGPLFLSAQIMAQDYYPSGFNFGKYSSEEKKSASERVMGLCGVICKENDLSTDCIDKCATDIETNYDKDLTFGLWDQALQNRKFDALTVIRKSQSLKAKGLVNDD